MSESKFVWIAMEYLSISKNNNFI